MTPESNTSNETAAILSTVDLIDSAIAALEFSGLDLRAENAEELIADLTDPAQAIIELRQLADLIEAHEHARKEAA
ncbi:hypothetical protein [Agrobacterium vitis]|uniref:Uncharacterized protein n=1 Tax=Agrobacterium vitis TaxID=373 RepID=A0AAE2UW09_AGRVI|nr:hypothetical protein [Agrobacterium vitis]MBF2716896.1 hypothetical protein [Agrobacterium vitis]